MVSRRADVWVVVAIVATAFVIGWPILAGGWLTYFDNGPHLAEIHSRATEGAGGWSSVGFAGLSLDTLHSPLVGHLFLWLEGTPLLAPLYACCICLAIAAPAVAVYAVARRRVGIGWAAALAYVVLVQRGTIVGSGSASGGMWPFYTAAGLWVLLADRLARAERRSRDVAAIAALLAVIGLLHLFVLEAAVFLVIVHAAWRLPARGLRALAPDAIACAVAVAACATYWLPVALGAGGFQDPQNLPFGMLWKLLVLPTDTIELLAGTPTPSLPGYLETLPLVLPILGAVISLRYWRRGQDDRLAMIGTSVAALVLALLIVAPALHLKALGPVSWRFLTFVRLGCVLGSIPLLQALDARVRARVPAAAALGIGAAAIASGLLWGTPLREDVPASDSPEMTDVRALWTWLGEHARGERVYLQDTFYAWPLEQELSRSHVLALTLHESGVEPLGPYYGVIPAATEPATISEFGALFGRRPRSRVLRPGQVPLADWGIRLIVTCTPDSETVLRANQWPVVTQIGRFTVFSDPSGQPLAPRGTRDGDRRLVFELDHDAILAASYHAFWSIADAPPGAQLGREPAGRMAITGLPEGHHRVVLAYAPPFVWPASVGGWLGIGLLAFRRRRTS